MGRKDKIVQQEDSGVLPLGARMRGARHEKAVSLSAMAKLVGYTKGYLSTIETGGTHPSPELVALYERHLGLKPGTLSTIPEKAEKEEDQQPLPLNEVPHTPLISLFPSEQGELSRSLKEDLGEAPRIRAFWGREQNIEDLEAWILEDNCQIVTVLGLGGMGKTTLAAYLSEKIKDEFDYVFWRSLQNAPPLETLLKSCIQFLSDYKQIDLPEDADERIAVLIKYLRDHRCLVILDNLESVLGSGKLAGQYKEGYEGYGTLLRQVGEVEHQSCLLLTTREKPKEIPLLEGKPLHVRTMSLSGVMPMDAEKILEGEGLTGDREVWQRFSKLYDGNPLALKLVAEPIRELFRGDIQAFLDQEEVVIGDINTLLSNQFSRLSKLEQDILYWLASGRGEAVSLDSLCNDITPLETRAAVLEALNSLRRRLMIETQGTANFQLQPVILEYVTSAFVEKICEEISAETPVLFSSHTLMKAQAKEYVRENQLRLILAPLEDRLLRVLGREDCEIKLQNILKKLRRARFQNPNYIAGNVLNLLSYMHYDLHNYDFSGLFVRQAHLQGVELHNVNFSKAELKDCVFMDTFGSILCVSVSPDGKLLATGTANGEIRLWDTATGTPRSACEGHMDWVTSLAFNPTDSNMLASGSDDHTIRLWDATTGRCLATLIDEEGHNSRIKSIAFSADGKTLASGSEERTIRLWNVETGQVTGILEGHEGWVRAVAFSSDGELLASGGEDRTVRLWDTATQQCIHVLDEHSERIRTVAFDLDGDRLASGSDDQTVRVWDVNSGTCQHILHGHSNRIYSVAFSPNSEIIASSGDDQTIRLWDAATGEPRGVLQRDSSRVYAVAFSPDSKMLTSGSDDQTIRQWNVDTGECLRVLLGYSGRVRAVAFSFDGNTLASGSEDKIVRLWDVNTGSYREDVGKHSSRIRSVAFSPDGQLLASGSEDPTIRLWDIQRNRLHRELEGSDWAYSVAFSPNGRLVAGASEDPIIRLWDVNTGVLKKQLKGHSSWVYSVAFSPDGTLLASGSDDHTIRLWDVHTGLCIHTLLGHTNRVYSVAFHPQGGLLASGSHDDTIRLWEVATGKELKALPGYGSWVYSVAFSPDGKTLAWGSEEPAIRRWGIESDRQEEDLIGHTSWVYTVAFSPDGRLLASGSHDGTTRLWNLQTGNHQVLRSERPYEGMNIRHTKGLTPAQKATLRDLGAIEN